MPDPSVFLWIAPSVAAAAAAGVNPNVIKTVLADGLSTFSIKGNPGFSNGPKFLPRNCPDFHILCNLVFDNFILADELFAIALQSFETCVWVNNYLYGKLLLSFESPTAFDEIFKVTSVLFFIPNLKLWSRLFYV